jgi:hypothetical protein
MKVGDRVKILQGKNAWLIWTDGMNKYVGQIAEIDSIDEHIAELKELPFIWDKSWLKKEDTMWDEKTVQAIKDSVGHWEEDIVKPLKGGGISEKTGAHNCPLCNLVGFHSMFSMGECETKCPLSLRGMSCFSENSPYKTFMSNKTLENAQNMVLALKSLFYPEEPKKEEVFYHIGQRFIHDDDKDEYILACIGGDEFTFIDVKGGMIKNSRGTANNSNRISVDEINKFWGDGTFTLKEDSK